MTTTSEQRKGKSWSISPIIAIAILVLAGAVSSTSTQYIGTIKGVKTYLADESVMAFKVGETTHLAFGRYYPTHDRSGPGYIYLYRYAQPESMYRTFQHEYCHFRQDMERRAFNETECYEKEEST